jgi:hypothetical protein
MRDSGEPSHDRRPPAAAALLAASLSALGWLLRALARLTQLIPLAFRALATMAEFVKGRWLTFRSRPDDIWIAAYPRSGTTLTQMILYQLTTDGAMDFRHVSDVSPWFERTMALRRWDLDRYPSPRLLKTHLAYRMVPKTRARYIYVTRDGRDVAVSYYHMQQSHTRFRGSFEKFFSRFLRGRVVWGSWFRHVSRWTANPKDLDILYVTYEQLVGDLESTVRKIADFCGIELREQELPRILERCSFAFMKRHEVKFDYHTERLLDQGLQPGAFIREGKAGSSKAVLTAEQEGRFERERARWLDPADRAGNDVSVKSGDA